MIDLYNTDNSNVKEGYLAIAESSSFEQKVFYEEFKSDKKALNAYLFESELETKQSLFLKKKVSIY